MTGFETGDVSANGINFHYLETGVGPLVLCLHGFPDNALTYRYLLPALADAGFRAVAPYMRGYAPTGRPKDERYQSVLLAQDVAALIPALGAEKAFVVGHDWGATATYGAAAFAPERIHKIVTLAALHPGILLAAATDYDFIRGLWHAYFFQMPFAEEAVAANDYEFLERLWQDMAPEYTPTAEIVESFKATFRQPGVLTSALSYYRQTFNPANHDPALASLQESMATAPTPVPALAFFGTRDRPGRLEAFERMDRLFANGLEKVILPGAGHFIHLERPAEVNRKIVDFLSTW
jgi:pimeloyl-ACP methyl ester carboxylesterase